MKSYLYHAILDSAVAAHLKIAALGPDGLDLYRLKFDPLAERLIEAQYSQDAEAAASAPETTNTARPRPPPVEEEEECGGHCGWTIRSLPVPFRSSSNDGGGRGKD